MEYGVVLVWWVAFVVLGAVGLPIAAVLLETLPDGGAGLALPVAFAVLLVPVYWLGHLHFGPWTVAVGALGLAVLSAVLARRAQPVHVDRFLEWVVVFTLAFLLVVVIRALNPSIVPAGGEKFLDYGLLRAILRAHRLPPQDMWFADAPVAYYYGGHLLAACLATLTATAAKYAYNLALAGFYAALVGAAYGVAGSLGAARGRSYRLAGALGAFFVGFASNVAPVLEVAIWSLPGGTGRGVAAFVADRTAMPADQIATSGAFTYWTASRVIRGTINEFPFFSFFNGDLHAHMSSTPFLLLVAGIGLAYVRTPGSAVRRRRLLVVGAIPPVAGLLAVVNTWSLPTAVGLTGLALLFAEPSPRDLLPRPLDRALPSSGPARLEVVRMATALLVAVVVALLAVVWVLPFVLGPATGASGRSLGVLPERSGLLEFVLVHGWFLLVYGLYLGGRALPLADERRATLAVAAGVVVVVVGLLADAAAVAVLLPLLALAWYLLRREGEVGYETVLFVAGAGLVLLVEFLFVNEQAGPGRFNTVFKTYMEVWVLWGVGAGAALATLAPRRRDLRTTGGQVAAVLVVALVALASVYGVLALGARVDGAPPASLDATTWARTYHPQEWQAIEFLDRQPGDPVIVTAPGCWCNDVDSIKPYGWANAPSTFAGLPTVAGWSHEVGYRGRAPYDRRVADVRTIYTGSTGERLALLRQYHVRYVYVGPNERALYDDPQVGDTPGLTVAFRNDAVTIYAVNGTGSST